MSYDLSLLSSIFRNRRIIRAQASPNWTAVSSVKPSLNSDGVMDRLPYRL
jgi:hypothetical protein